MKEITLVVMLVITALTVTAQGNSGNKGKDKNKPAGGNSGNPGNSTGNQQENKTRNDQYDLKVWDGIAGTGSTCMKPSRNQPAKVRAAFQRDYPNASFVRWSKCRGDWTASFNNGIFRSTAVYHANGDRRDTRSYMVRESLPVKILDVILKRLPGISIEGGVRIEVPNIVRDIFRIKSIVQGQPQYLYYNTDGVEVQYNY